jgi:hypothetical protein
MNELERRYHRLLMAYPADYRRARGAEIVGTYLDLAAPGQRRPSLADAADLMRGGLRQRLRAAGAADLVPGVRLAAVLAFVTGAALAAAWSVAETYRLPADLGYPGFGPVNSAGALVWAAWLLAAGTALASHGRMTRSAILVAVVLTVAIVPIRTLADLPRPPLLVLVPQIALGLLALALPDRLSRSARIALPLAMGTAALLAVSRLWNTEWWVYHGVITELKPMAGLALLTAALLVGTGLAVRRDSRGLWVILALLTPVGLLYLNRLAGSTSAPLIVVTLAVSLLGPVAIAATLAGRRWMRWRPIQNIRRLRR